MTAFLKYWMVSFLKYRMIAFWKCWMGVYVLKYRMFAFLVNDCFLKIDNDLLLKI